MVVAAAWAAPASVAVVVSFPVWQGDYFAEQVAVFQQAVVFSLPVAVFFLPAVVVFVQLQAIVSFDHY